jgi:hypothetical protein
VPTPKNLYKSTRYGSSGLKNVLPVLLPVANTSFIAHSTLEPSSGIIQHSTHRQEGKIMNIRLLQIALSCLLTFGIISPAFADLNCSINSLLGSNCLEIEKINQFQEKQQQAWLNGEMNATEMVNSIVNYHRSLTEISIYDKELYLYDRQVARVCDAGKISKEEGLYLMTMKENELGERMQSRQPPQNRPLTCRSETFGGTTTTKCQ